MEVRMHRKRSRRMRFHDREREIKEIMNIIESADANNFRIRSNKFG